MSLKAKLEAVIYAAEEPVTLAQLTAIFAEEALQWSAEREAAAATAQDAPVGAAAAQLNDAFPYLEPIAETVTTEPAALLAASPAIVAGDESSTAVVTSGAPAETESSAPAEQASEEAAPEPMAEPEAEGEAAAKQAAKQREREARAAIKQLLAELVADYAAEGRGIEIREIAGGYRMATKPEFHDAVRAFVKGQKPPLKLSLPALETLAVIAYKQPVTAPEVNEIRGVDSSGVFGSLLARKLIVTAGRKPVVGRPILYKTTREFLLRFGLKDVSELPSMEEFEKMAASELDSDEAPQEAGAASGEVEEFTPDPSVEDPNVELEEAEAVAPEPAAGNELQSNPSDGAERGAPSSSSAAETPSAQ